jgi:hypothetical protein
MKDATASEEENNQVRVLKISAVRAASSVPASAAQRQAQTVADRRDSSMSALTWRFWAV